MDENVNGNDLSIIENGGGSVPLSDFLFALLRNLHWIILCGLIGGAYAYYSVKGEERIYGSNTTILIKTLSDKGSDATRESALIRDFSGVSIALSSINNEIMIMRSRSIMMSMVRKLNLNTEYSYKTKIAKRNKDLYGDSPIFVVFPDMSEEIRASMIVTPMNENTVSLSGFGANDIPDMIVTIGDTVFCPIGRVSVQKSWFYGEGFFNVPISVVHYPVSQIADEYRYKVQIQRDDSKNTIIRLSLQDTSPIRAAEVLNALVEAYNEDAVNDQKRLLDYSYQYIDERIEYLEKDLTLIEEEIASFKKDNLLLDVKDFGQSFMESSIASSEEVKKLESQAAMAHYIINYVKNNRENHLIPNSSSLSNDATLNLITKYNETVLELEKYEKDKIGKNPTVQNLISSLEVMKTNIVSVLENYVTGIDDKIAMAKRKSYDANRKMQSVPEQQRYYTSVERIQNIKENLYQNLLARREEMHLTQPTIEDNAKVVDAARINQTPIYPNEKKSTIMGLLLGLAFPTIIIILIKLLDSRIHDKKDVERLTRVPFLGEIPYQKNLGKHAIVVTENSNDAISESFRLIRSNMDYMKDKNQRCQVIMFTSFMVSSGKTFVCSNLASSFALANKKVLIMDLDIRKGTLTKVFDIKAKVGVTNYLSGKIDDINEIMHHHPTIPNFDMIFAGSIPPNPSELLMSDRLDQLIDILRLRYDYIFLDNVPLGMVADADIIKRFSDITVFVVRAMHADKRLLRELDQVYKLKKLPNLAMVLNSVKYKKRLGYGYGYGYRKYGYGYGYYGYGYGYSQDANSSKSKGFLHKRKKQDLDS